MRANLKRGQQHPFLIPALIRPEIPLDIHTKAVELLSSLKKEAAGVGQPFARTIEVGNQQKT
jgi:hypothetical protein